ncbi:Smr/MutS family protein [Acinetobacter sp. B5B]|uniref:Smr/MutS family protein n=1 Tax=Acinetobacter baretiae TaxID=2605383 RepID=UPI0018C2CBD6|nr:Smr/MutS family protein [Acinetobacter baretiae]MBF7682930.1 Smr/MutS family protein [Acinetobacter baretiae]MBF7684897.1 Smr/MutS family protein [Acinetobacter baretiae]
MSKQDSFLSKEQEKLLKAFRKQISPMQHADHKAQVSNMSTEQAHVQNDDDLFKKAMQGVEKFAHSNHVAPVKVQKKKLDAQLLAKRAAAEGAHEHDTTAMSDTQAILNPVGSQQSLSYRTTTLQHKVFDELKTGKLRWFEAVDLHGCTVEQARTAVLDIIQMAKTENQTVIKIVHGKGPEAILKTYVNGWLRQHQDVLAFVSAPENQGGTGAVLVLLKRRVPIKNEKA